MFLKYAMNPAHLFWYAAIHLVEFLTFFCRLCTGFKLTHKKFVFIFYTDFHAPIPQENWDLGAHTITISFREAVRYEPTG